MYFYNCLLLISNIIMLTLLKQTQTANGPGKAACLYFIKFNDGCKLPIAKLSEIPDDCTSIFYHAVYMDLATNQIYADPFNTELNNKLLGNLDEVLSGSKPVYLIYSYGTLTYWNQALACNGGKNYEMEILKAFFGKHDRISGVILSFEENDEEYTGLTEFSENLKKYLDVMKMTFPELQIGIQLEGHFLLDHYTDSQKPWLDIKVIEPCTDFFILDLIILNLCTDESLYNSGIAPMTSTTTDYTMEKIKGILPELSIPKEKLYFKYRLNPTSDPNDSLTYCELTIQQMCEHPQDTCLYCSDTMESFYEKGQFAFEHGAGFTTTCITYNDFENKCKCEKPFGSFYALLNGFDGGDKPCCKLFPRK